MSNDKGFNEKHSRQKISILSWLILIEQLSQSIINHQTLKKKTKY